ETGNYYYGARYLNPKWSIWLSVDPLAEETMQPYSYANLNPVKFVDPTGMKAEDPPLEVYYEKLDKVVVTEKTSNSNNNSDYTGMPQWMRNTAFQEIYWASDYKGSLNDYNREKGTDYGSHNPGDVYSQWYYQTQYKPAYEKMIRDMHASQLKVSLTTLAVAFAPYAIQGVGYRAAAKMGIDASAQYAITGEIDYFDVVSSGVAPAGLAPALN